MNENLIFLGIGVLVGVVLAFPAALTLMRKTPTNVREQRDKVERQELRDTNLRLTAERQDLKAHNQTLVLELQAIRASQGCQDTMAVVESNLRIAEEPRQVTALKSPKKGIDSEGFRVALHRYIRAVHHVQYDEIKDAYRNLLAHIEKWAA